MVPHEHIQGGERLRHLSPIDDLSLESSAFPGGSLLSAVFDRDLMRLSDRGGASGMIGDRWAELCSRAIDIPQLTPLDPTAPDPLLIERVIRLDHIPQVASVASKRKLQNPDFLLLGSRDGRAALQAADAKFSVETARSRQVSAEVTTQLLDIGPLITRHVGILPAEIDILDGIFLCPDYSLTHYMLKQRRGLRRVAVGIDELILLPVSTDDFLVDLDCLPLVDLLANLDALPLDYHQSLLLALYYLRLARACIACWLDRTRPLLAFKEERPVDMEEVMRMAQSLAVDAHGGWELVGTWDSLAEDVRRQRIEVDHVASVPLGGADLRRQIAEAAEAAGVEPPSVNRVRRRVGAWYRRELLLAFGPLKPPLEDFAGTLEKMGQHARSLKAQVPEETAEVILELVTEVPMQDIDAAVLPA